VGILDQHVCVPVLQLRSRRSGVPEPTPAPSDRSSRSSQHTLHTARQPRLGDARGHGREAERAMLPAQAAPLAMTWAGPGKARSCLRGRAALRCCRRGRVAPCGAASSPSCGHGRSGKRRPRRRDIGPGCTAPWRLPARARNTHPPLLP
jgi:hypothetical protein